MKCFLKRFLYGLVITDLNLLSLNQRARKESWETKKNTVAAQMLTDCSVSLLRSRVLSGCLTMICLLTYCWGAEPARNKHSLSCNNSSRVGGRAATRCVLRVKSSFRQYEKCHICGFHELPSFSGKKNKKKKKPRHCCIPAHCSREHSLKDH